MEHVNPLAVAVAALTNFMLGGLWYSPLMFLKTWEQESGQAARTNDKGRHPALVFGLAYVLACVAALFFTWILGPQPGLSKAITQGLIVGLAFVASSFGINYLFGGQSLKLWMINAGYHGVQFFLYGLVFGLWP